WADRRTDDADGARSGAAASGGGPEPARLVAGLAGTAGLALGIGTAGERGDGGARRAALGARGAGADGRGAVAFGTRGRAARPAESTAGQSHCGRPSGVGRS